MQQDENRKARILIVDDHSVVRHGIASLINQETDLYACCESGDIQHALTANHACPHDLAIIDLSLDGMSGLELVKQFHLEAPDLLILVMSMHNESIYAEPALRAGAHGYLMKQAATETMLTAIRQILDGDIFLSDKMRSSLHKAVPVDDTEANLVNRLTPGEFEVFHMIGLGLGTSKISQKLNRSIKTIESHRANIKKKLNLRTGNELVYLAISLANCLKTPE